MLVLACISQQVLASLVIEGVDETLAVNVRAHVKLAQEPCNLPAWRITQYRRDIPKQVEVAMQAYGYYRYTLKQQLQQSNDCWQLHLAINPGPRTHLRRVQITPLKAPETLIKPLRELIVNPPLKSGMPLLHREYDNYKSALLDTARSNGYWQAQYQKSELAIYPEDNAADAILEIIIGPRYVFGDAHFPELLLNQELLQRLTGEVRGTPYSEEELQDIYRRFQGSDYFRKVIITPSVDTNSDEYVVPLDFDLAMNARHNFGAGVGFSTDQGPRLRGNYRNRYLNAAGHRWSNELLISDKLRELLGTYIIPRRDAAKEWYELSVGYVEEEYSSYQSNTTSTSARAITALAEDWVLNAGVNIRNERYIIGSEPDDRKILVVPGAGVSWIDAREEPRQKSGFRFETGITFSHHSWASDVNFVQGYARLKGIVSFFSKGRIISRIEGAGTLMEDFDELPPSVRFYTGGDNSIRGYDYNSIGSIDESTGEVKGGSKLAVASLEYDHLILKNWSLSTFVDAGDAYDKELDLKKSWGVGVRWYSPVGPMRIDLAFPQDSKNDYRFHISVGADL
ncbi:translocation and assembly module TamA [Alteromonadaceae bacterium 2753L.S.0a.02]|nr:translocation and assembly module TamA [Alteromonadaceae bacterium 2753L.S.0a.02]